MKVTALRAGAFAIAVLAVIDPAVKSRRASRPLIAMLTDSSAHGSLAARVANELGRRYTVVRGTLDAAAATVIVGDGVPDEGSTLRSPVVAVVPRLRQPYARIVNVDVPAISAVNSRIPVVVTVRVSGARGRRLEARLASGLVTVDRASWNVTADTTITVTLHHVVVSPGPHALRIATEIDGAASDSAMDAFDARVNRLAVFFFDPRPSWMSTFVRRALEGDPRFSVTHRVATSRGLVNTSGSAPASLHDAAALSRFATIVVSGPELLSDRDADGLEAFMRRRGGRVVLLMERRAAAAVDRLTGVSAWRTTQSAAPLTLEIPTGLASLRARELAWPATLPPVATALAVSVARDPARRAIIWSVPVGAGQLQVSGALDGWHHRDVSSGFHAFWTATIAELSNGAPEAVEAVVSRHALAPGDVADVRVIVRDVFLAALPERTANVGAALMSASDTARPRLWPTGTPGVFRGRIVAPRDPGAYRLIVSAGGDSSETSMIVDRVAGSSPPDDPQVIAAFASSRGGSVVTEESLNELSARLASALEVVPRVETWYPMRSTWWIVPFALLLGAEWWWRRRRGLA